MIPVGMSEKEYFELHASQEEFLDWYYQQELPRYEKPCVTIDMVAYCFVEGKMKLLLIRRKAHPYQNFLSLVGDFMDKGEDAAHAYQREVNEEANLDLPLEKIEQLMTVLTPGRDPRAFAFDHYAIIQESIKRIQGRLDWDPTFLYLLEEEFTVYEGTELVNLINPGRPIVSNNFLVKYGEYVEEVGLKRVPKKKPRKPYRLK